MKNRMQLLLHSIALSLITVLLAGLETTTFLQLFGSFTPPALWLCVLLHVAITRSRHLAIALAYLMAVFLMSMTVMPFGVLAAAATGTVLAAQYFKSRIFWPTVTYSMLLGGLGSLCFNILATLSYWIFVRNPMGIPSFSDWLIQAMLTPLVAPIIFWGLRIVDGWMDFESSEMKDVES